ncbi:MAG TPA: hypothetical protein VJK06_01665, partial [Methyloceanibacter sp.]|nr:hypothetical protein [Methyloceanibacter sp.]
MTDDPILSTKDRIGDYDAIASAKPGEPLFGLQGGDPFAPNAIERWARLARQAALKMSDGEDRDKLLKKATAAELVAWKFREYYATTARGEAYEEDAPPAPTFASEDVTDRAVILARAADRLH